LAFYQRFEQIANDSHDSESDEDGEQARGRARPVDPRILGRAYPRPGERVEPDRQQGPADAFPGLARADRRRELALPEPPPDEIGRRIRNPHRAEYGEEQGRMNTAQVDERGARWEQHQNAHCKQRPARRSRAAPYPQGREEDPEEAGSG